MAGIVLGVVLAGGRSRRMGTEKAEVEVGGLPMIRWVVSALEAVTDEVVISGRSFGDYRQLEDAAGMSGPLAGLAPALSWSDDLLVVAVDQPWVRAETLSGLAELSGTKVPVDNSVAQVTCARYSRDVEISQNDGSLQSIVHPSHYVAESVWRTWGEDGRSWFSVDTPADLQAGLDLYGPPAKSGRPLA